MLSRVLIDCSAWWSLPQKLRFLVAGLFNTILGYGIFSTLYLALGDKVHFMVVGVLSQMVSLCCAFATHRWLVFRSASPWVSSFLRFNVSQLFTFGLGLTILYFFVHFAHLSPLGAQALAVLITVFVAYFLHKYYSFRQLGD
jgi:putative flippase GtrA